MVANGPASDGHGKLFNLLMNLFSPFLGQSAAAGALPTLLAATAPTERGAAYYGLTGFAELRGAPGEAHVGRPGRDLAVAARLWDVSERLTGVRFELPVAA
ncbi:MAG: hypothetical protein OHK0022_17400 [Roseiflexaceae bacterium]